CLKKICISLITSPCFPAHLCAQLQPASMKIIHPASIPVVFIALLLYSCTSPKSYNATTVGQQEDLIKKGDMSTHISLTDLQNKPHLYAIGSVTNLQGFVVIDDGK